MPGVSIHFDEGQHPRGHGGRFVSKTRSVQELSLRHGQASVTELIERWDDPLEESYLEQARAHVRSGDPVHLELAGRLIRRGQETAAFFEEHGEAGVDQAREVAPELVLPTAPGVDVPSALAQLWRRKGEDDASPWGGWHGIDPADRTPVSPSLPGADTPYSARIFAEVEAQDAYEVLSQSTDEIGVEEITRAYNEPVPPAMRTAIGVARPDADPGMVEELGRQLRHQVTLSRWFREQGVEAMTQADEQKPDWILAKNNTEDWWEWSQANADEWEQQAEMVLRRPAAGRAAPQWTGQAHEPGKRESA